MTVRVRSSFRQAVRAVLLAAGTGCLGYAAYGFIYQRVHQFEEQKRFDQALTALKNDTRTNDTQTKAEPAVHSTPPLVRRATPALPGTLGRISIPRLRLSAMVEEGVNAGTLRGAVGHIPGTPLPGEAGNVGIAGHRDTFFRPLKNLQLHDRIVFTTLGATYRYAVEDMEIVEPQNVRVLRPTGIDTLTMVTCYPFTYIGAAPKRFVVHARLVGTGAEAQNR